MMGGHTTLLLRLALNQQTATLAQRADLEALRLRRMRLRGNGGIRCAIPRCAHALARNPAYAEQRGRVMMIQRGTRGRSGPRFGTPHESEITSRFKGRAS